MSRTKGSSLLISSTQRTSLKFTQALREEPIRLRASDTDQVLLRCTAPDILERVRGALKMDEMS